MADNQAAPDGDTARYNGRAFIILPPATAGGRPPAEPVFRLRPSPVQAIWLEESGPMREAGA